MPLLFHMSFSIFVMGRLSNYMNGVSVQALERGRRLFNSRLMRYGLLATVISAIALPAIAPLLGAVFVAAPLAYHGSLSLLRPLMDNLSFGMSGMLGGLTAGNGQPSGIDSRSSAGQTADSQDVRIPKGKKVGEPMTDLLVKKMRDIGMTVTTDWKMSDKFLKTLPKKYSHLKGNRGSIRGFVYEGVIHINPKFKSTDTPIHEYTHLWAEVLRQKNPDEWRNIVELMKQDRQLWNNIVSAYPYLENDDEIADEVLATYSGRRGSGLLEQYYQKGDNPNDSLRGVEQALERFWKAVCGFLGVHYTSKEDVADAVLADLLKGVNPLDYADKDKEKLSDRKPLHALDHNHLKENTIMEKNNINILTGEEARRTVGEILANNPNPGDYMNKNALYPVHLGAIGYFRDTAGNGDMVYSAFDNSTGDCWCEDFMTEEGARKWCSGELSTDEVRELESNVEEIILSDESFEALKGQYNSLPPYVKFDENGEMSLKMQFYDGYAFDTNLHGLGYYDRIALYYPTISEVANDVFMQDKIEHTTGRRWDEGSDHEKIYDIALHYGQASRMHCPKHRYDAAVNAIVERAGDPSLRAFTPEQRAAITLAADSDSPNHDADFDRVPFYDVLFGRAKKIMDAKGILPAWQADAHEELRGLAKGEVRDENIGLRR